MAYIEVDVELDQFSDSEIISECVTRSGDEDFINGLKVAISQVNIPNQELWDIAKDMQAGKDVTEKLKKYIWDTVGVIV